MFYEEASERADSIPQLAQSYSELLRYVQSQTLDKQLTRPSEFSSKDLQTVGNYSVGKLIGKGSFGKVYLATHNLTNGSKVRGKQKRLGAC